jgi:hypothetical protein
MIVEATIIADTRNFKLHSDRSRHMIMIWHRWRFIIKEWKKYVQIVGILGQVS